ncbi:MAG: hypothetical protein Q9M40_01925 [Sulfurimonas sp.]|nr:hypothetical protein [Sulfurimonas sp.]MDQ7066842.1 hypothetical protein [Sulfurimonas sp.]
MKNMKKVELIIEAVYTKRLIDLFTNHNINGYTIIKDIEGYGGHGLRTADDGSDVFSNIYVFTVCDQAVFEDMEKDLRKFISRYGGKCILSDVMMLVGKDK